MKLTCLVLPTSDISRLASVHRSCQLDTLFISELSARSMHAAVLTTSPVAVAAASSGRLSTESGAVVSKEIFHGLRIGYQSRCTVTAAAGCGISTACAQCYLVHLSRLCFRYKTTYSEGSCPPNALL